MADNKISMGKFEYDILLCKGNVDELKPIIASYGLHDYTEKRKEYCKLMKRREKEKGNDDYFEFDDLVYVNPPKIVMEYEGRDFYPDYASMLFFQYGEYVIISMFQTLSDEFSNRSIRVYLTRLVSQNVETLYRLVYDSEIGSGVFQRLKVEQNDDTFVVKNLYPIGVQDDQTWEDYLTKWSHSFDLDFSGDFLLGVHSYMSEAINGWDHVGEELRVF